MPNFSIEYVSDSIKGYSGIYNKGRREWKINYERLARLEWLVKKIDPKKGEKILELGCGFGPLLYRCAKKEGLTKMIGIDISFDKLLLTKAFFDKQGFSDRVKFCLSSGQNLPFKAGYFDKILLIDVLEHMEDNLKAKVLKECFRVLRTEGSLLINTPNLNYLTQGLRFKRIIRKLTLRNPLKLDIPLTPNSSIKDDHVDLTTTALLKKMLYNSGFKDVEFLLKTDNIYGILLMPLYLCSLNMKESLCQSITLKCIK